MKHPAIGPALSLGLCVLWLATFFMQPNESGGGTLFGATFSETTTRTLMAFGPLVLIWMVYGLIHGLTERRRTLEAIERVAKAVERTVGQTEAQARSMIELGALMRAESATSACNILIRDLICQSALIAERLGLVDRDGADTAWARTGAGDQWAFATLFLASADADATFVQRLGAAAAGDPPSMVALNDFVQRYDQATRALTAQGAQKLALAVLEDGPLARLHRLFAEGLRIANAVLANPAPPVVSAPLAPEPEAFVPPGEPQADSARHGARPESTDQMDMFGARQSSAVA